MRYATWIGLLLFAGWLSGQSIRPYLQSAQPTSIIVNWKTDNGDQPKVSYGLLRTELTTEATGVTVDLEPKDTDYSTPYHYHSVQLTGLVPNTGYYYRAESGASDESAIHYFKTPPAKGSKPDKLRFIALGDHQLLSYEGRPYHKFDELVQAAKAKAQAVYGTPVADHFNLILNDGDQVDLGKLEHYEQIHFAKSSYLSADLPIITAVGNHENYGNSYAGGGIQAYFDHFVLDGKEIDYGNIDSSTERYYAYQLANVLFVVLDTEAPGTAQSDWLQDVVGVAKQDEGISWVISIGHRPYQAEQYSDDYSAWLADTLLPELKQTKKFVLHISGHHHLYARGQFKDHNAYHLISGGTAWPQYWGDSEKEDDREETQGTWSNFAYQFIEVDNVNQELIVRSYTIGSLQHSKDSELLDEVRLKRGVAVPDRPRIINAGFSDQPIRLPFALLSSPFNSPAGQVFNSTQFQVAADRDFSAPDLDTYRHRDNWYGPLDGQTDVTQNIGEGLDILNYTIPAGSLPSGTYYARVRHRDANLGWSAWSPVVRIIVEAGKE